jgi:hypothetical protein
MELRSTAFWSCGSSWRCVDGLLGLSTVLKIHFTTEDLARTTFLSEPAPLLELKLALIALHRRVRAPRLNGWRRAALARFPESARPLWDLAAGFSGAISTTAVSGDMDQALDVARGLSREEAVREARIWFGDGAVPSWGRDIVAGDRDLARNLTRALSGAYAAVLRPHWSSPAGRQSPFGSRRMHCADRGAWRCFVVGLLPTSLWWTPTNAGGLLTSSESAVRAGPVEC